MKFTSGMPPLRFNGIFDSMRTFICFIVILLITLAAYPQMHNSLIVYPAPQGAPGNDNFKVKVRRPGEAWQDLHTYAVKVDEVKDARHTPQQSSMTYFDFTGTVEIAVTYTTTDIRSVRIRPLSYHIQPVVKGNTISFSISQPRNVSIEINGDIFHNLQLFAGLPETEKALPTDPKTLYYGPGIHQIGTVMVPDSTTVYIAGGAMVEGQFLVRQAKDVRIIGRGILYQTSSTSSGSKTRLDNIRIESSDNITVDGIIVLPVTYTVLMGNSRHVTIRNLKSFSAGGNNDGIDVFCSSDVLIDHVFMRNSDDNIAIYGHRWDYYGNVRNITVKNSSLWADVAHPIVIGTHGDPPHPDTLEDMTFSNLDILDQSEAQIDYQGCMSIDVGDANLARNIRFQDIRVEDFRLGQLLNLRVMYNHMYNTAPGAGIDNILFKNISYEGSHANLSIIAGYDSMRSVRNITFEDLQLNGRLIWDKMPGKPGWYKTADFAHIYIGEHVEGIKFITTAE